MTTTHDSAEDNMRKICIVVNSRANYARIKSVILAVQEHPQLELQLIVGASALLDRFGRVIDIIRSDGIKESAVVYMALEGDTPANMVKSTALGMIELSTLFEQTKPDVVLTVADRHETLATAVSASYMNIPLAHTQGGEETGSIDECVRHAITKLAHVHFPATAKARDTLLRMGEAPDKVFLTGCPAMDIVTSLASTRLDQDFFARNPGVGNSIDPLKPYIVVLQHPVTTEYGSAYAQIDETLNAILSQQVQTVWLWPNIDAGTDQISKRLRQFRESRSSHPVFFVKNLSAEDYVRLIDNCACLVGNSSSALREGALLGVPAVNIGTRQSNREHGPNVVHAPYAHDAIDLAIRQQMAHGKYQSNALYGDGHAGKRIADILASVTLDIRKRLVFSN